MKMDQIIEMHILFSLPSRTPSSALLLTTTLMRRRNRGKGGAREGTAAWTGGGVCTNYTDNYCAALIKRRQQIRLLLVPKFCCSVNGGIARLLPSMSAATRRPSIRGRRVEIRPRTIFLVSNPPAYPPGLRGENLFYD